MEKRILCVIRVSTLHQEMESQRNDMFSWLTDKGLGYHEDEIEWLVAKGASARKVDADYLQMLDSIKSICLNNETIKAVAVWHLNRLGRWEEHLSMMKAFFRKNLIQVYVKTPRITLLNELPNGDFELNQAADITWNTFASLVEYDTLEMVDKMQRGKNEKKSKGLYVGQPLKYGFTVENDIVIPDIDKMQVVKKLYQLYSTGNYSYFNLHNEFTSRGIKLSERLIQSILTHEDYIEFVGQDLYDRVKDIRINVKLRNSNKQTVNHYLALGLLKCTCGYNYTANSEYYVCYKKKNAFRFTDKCSSPNISVQVVDTIIWDIASTLHRQYLMTIDEQSVADYKDKKQVLIQKVNKINSDLITLNESLDRLNELYVDGVLSKSKYNDKKVSVLSKINTLNINLDLLKKDIEITDNIIADLSNKDINRKFKIMASITDDLPYQDKQNIVRQHIVGISVYNMLYNGISHTKITVLSSDERTFVFAYNGRSKKGVYDKLFRVVGNMLLPYTYSRQSLHDVIQNQIDGVVK